MTQTFIDFARGKMKMTINGAYDFVEKILLNGLRKIKYCKKQLQFNIIIVILSIGK